MRAGLCGACAHQRVVPASRATYSMCRLAADDPRFPRYPPLPVIRCAGFAPVPPREEGGRAEDGTPPSEPGGRDVRPPAPAGRSTRVMRG